ncbi:MAG: hypothetical protein ABIH11_01405 [Candidatus Altiarchaeota archaeon]
MFELQQPYIPVCLMTAAVMGTEYYYHLHTIRSFRDRVMLGRMGVAGGLLADVYYSLSELSSDFVHTNRFVKKLVLHGIVRPLGHVLGKLL